MARVIEKQVFRRVQERSNRTFSDIEFRKCEFESCSLSLSTNLDGRTRVSNAVVSKCKVRQCNIGIAIIEDTLVEDLQIGDLLRCTGTVFRHVKLRGRIGPLLLLPDLENAISTEQQRRAARSENARYYEGVDWALDITEAEFTEECDLSGVPAHLIRRDPETQAIVTREQLLSGTWRSLGLKSDTLTSMLQVFLDDGSPATVLAAPKRGRGYQTFLNDLRLLRDRGLAA